MVEQKTYIEQLRSNQHVRIGVLLGLIIIVIWMVYSRLYFDGVEGASNIGDAYGSLNTLFSGLAFGGVILAIIMQGQELKLQRQEMALQREELNRTRKEFEELTKTAELQRFEHSFYNMLNGFQTLISNLSVSYYIREVNEAKLRKINGEDVFYCLLNDDILREQDTRSYDLSINKWLENACFNSSVKVSGADLGTFQSIYSAHHPIHSISHYFKYLFRMIYFIHYSDAFDRKHINESENLDPEEIKDLIFLDKNHYTSIIRSYLSENQLVLLYLNELNPRFTHMKSFIEEYSLLKNLRAEAIIIENYKDYYEPEAFEAKRSATIRQRLKIQKN